MMMKKISDKKIKKLAEEGKLRDNVELWVDKHNHKMELIRRINGINNILLSIIIPHRVFKIMCTKKIYVPPLNRMKNPPLLKNLGGFFYLIIINKSV